MYVCISPKIYGKLLFTLKCIFNLRRVKYIKLNTGGCFYVFILKLNLDEFNKFLNMHDNFLKQP
jgi:hypothetical protein